MAELTDAEVFGTGGAAAPKSMSDAEVFGSAAMPAPPTALEAAGRGLGLGVRNVVQGTLGPLYDPIAAGLRTIGVPVHPLAENLTSLGLPQPQTPFERGASAVIEPVAGTLTGQGVGRALETAASPAVQAVGQALSSQPATQAVSAGVGGATTAATGSPLLGTAASMITPLAMSGAGAVGGSLENAALGGVSKSDAELGQLARDKYSIPVTARDMSDSSLLRITVDQSDKLPFSGARAATANKQTAWQGAVANELGEPGTTAFTPDVMTRAKGRIGQVFNDVATRTAIPPTETTPMLQDMARIFPQAQQVLTDAELKPLALQVKNIQDAVAKGNGTLSGDTYQALTRAKAPLDLAESSTNPNVAHYAGQIRDALDGAFARSATATDQDALTQARYQYRVMRTVDPLVAGSRDGNISPDAFMQKVLTASRRFDSPTGGMAYTGGGNIGELARIGKLMRAAPQTGTADRMLVNLGFLGGLAGGSSPLHPAAVLGVPAALAANRVAGAYLRSGGLANRLIGQAAGPATPNALLRALPAAGVTGLEAEAQRARSR